MILSESPRSNRHLINSLLLAPDPYGIRSCKPPDTIIDLGANCGLFSVLARFLYPEARIIAVEPDEKAFAACVINARSILIETYRIAIGSSGFAGLSGAPCGHVSSQFRSTGGNDILNDVPSCSLAELWGAVKPQGRIFLKCDIEGAEWQFVDDAETEACLRECQNVSAELHVGKSFEHGGEMVAEQESYARWAIDRFSATHVVHPVKYRRGRFGELRMVKKE